MEAAESIPVRIEFAAAPSEEAVTAVEQLAAEAEASDGNPPFSEQTLIELRKSLSGHDGVRVALAWTEQPGARDRAHQEGAEQEGGLLAGAGVVVLGDQQSPDVLEMAVRPSCRTHGIGAQLAEALASSLTGEGGAGNGRRAWVHGAHQAAGRLAARFGWSPVRELRRMRLTDTGSLAELPAPELPAGVTLRAFRPGTDEQAWLEANAAAFADHPEQGRLTLADLQARMAEAWFDPAGFLLAWEQGPDGEELLGFHWTKVHQAEDSGAPGEAPVGEVYVVGVVPEAQGRGLGRSLTLAGIEHLHREGLRAIMLYVDADNTAAVALYEKLGFTVWDVDTQYAPEA